MDARQRFSNRVADYVRYRPRYPETLIPLLADRCGLRPEHSVADIGSGTGILSEPFLDHGNTVYAVEPNGSMREAAEVAFGRFDAFHSVAGSAEATGLADSSVDFIAAGQAFHWFDPEKAAGEFRRILRPDGWTVLVWNERRADASGFLAAYDALLLQHGTDYASVDHRQIDDGRIASFFGGGAVFAERLENAQVLDRAGLAGRVRSCSYVPAEGEPGYAPMMAALDLLFDRHAVEGTVTMHYDTRVYLGRFSD